MSSKVLIKIVFKMPYYHWNDHSAHVMSLVGKLYQNFELTDCTLDTNGGLVRGHKTLLVACSPYLKKLIMDNQGMKIIPLKEVRYTDMKLILDFVYLGVVDISLSDVPSVIETARLLQIPYLSDIPSTISEKSSSIRSRGRPRFRPRDNIGDSKTHKGSVVNILSDTLNNIPMKSNDQDSNVTKIDTANECSENVQDTLPPFSFVAVSPFSGNSEHGDDEHNVCCDTPSEVVSPSEKNSNSGDTTKEIKMERDFESESEDRNETGEEDNVNETDDVYESMELKYISHGMGDNVIKNTENIVGNESTQNVGFVSSKGCFAEGMEDMKMESESICDASKFELSEVKLLETSSDNDSVGDDYDQLTSNETASQESSRLSRTCSKPTDKDYKLVRRSKEPLDSIQCDIVRSKRMGDDLEPLTADHSVHFAGSVDQASCSRKDGVRQSHNNGSELKLFSCNICDQSFDRYGMLKKHMLVHAGGKQFSCMTCNSSFGSESSLMLHMQTHTRERLFKCDICGAAFSLKSNLKAHKDSHAGIKRFKCDICGARFSRNGYLKTHKHIHAGIEPFMCDICGATFAQNSNLKKHKYIHTGIKPFTCDACGSAFLEKSNLKRHMRCHSGDKPFKCDICGTAFAQNSNLKTHKRIHTVQV